MISNNDKLPILYQEFPLRDFTYKDDKLYIKLGKSLRMHRNTRINIKIKQYLTNGKILQNRRIY